MQRQPAHIAEELLVLRAQAGDEDAFRGLVRLWTPRLTRHASRWLADVNTAADAAQEAWISIARSLRTLDDPARFTPWAYRIVQHKCVDLIRKDARHAAAVRRSAGSTDPQQPSESVDAVRLALRRLEPERRALLSLHYVDGLGVGQLAEVFSVPTGTVKSRLFAARNELKQILQQQEQGEES
ncbi:MAG: RNA polymerase sigma-70 factor (ECF subfamily) [Phycisphaerales bacterium]|jgi:RNA polymerase sigma-70 factor (ECF subfamily)